MAVRSRDLWPCRVDRRLSDLRIRSRRGTEGPPAKRTTYAEHDGERFLDAVQNARLVANAERYYRIMYYGSRASWNLRDSHMFETLKKLLAFYGPDSKAIVWAHNSHIGDAAATEMASRGEHNLGHLCRKEFGDRSYSIGFGTFTGTVAAASEWDGPMEIKTVRPAIPKSYEHMCHQTAVPSFLLGLPDGATSRAGSSGQAAPGASNRRHLPARNRAREPLLPAVLPQQFDEYIWFDQTTAVAPFETKALEAMPDTYPFGL